MSYFLAARDGEMPRGVQACAIHRHFLDAPHGICDLEIMLVDKVTSGIKLSLVPAMRVRMEARWRRRLGAVLNERVNIRHSFPGAYQAGPSQRAVL